MFHPRGTFAVACTTILALGAAPGASAQSQVSWSQLGGAAASDVGVGADGTLWAIDTLAWRVPADGKRVLRMSAGRFGSVDRAGVRIAVDPSGMPWVIDAHGRVFTWAGPPQRNSPGSRTAEPGMRSTQWSQRPMPVPALDVAVGANGAVWAVGRDFRIYHLVGTGFAPVAGSAVRIAVDPQGAAWIIDQRGKLLRQRGAAFDPVPGVESATDPSIAPNGTVFFLGKSSAPGAVGSGGGEQLYSIRRGTIRAESIGGVAVSAGPRSVYVALAPEFESRIYSRPYGTGDSATVTPLLIAIGTLTLSGSPVSATSPSSTDVPVGSVVTEQPASSTTGTLVISSGGLPGSPQEPLTAYDYTSKSEPVAGSLVCPIIGQRNRLELDCLAMTSAARKITGSPRTAASPSGCSRAGSFFDPRNGGECWSCPAGYTRNVSPVTSKDACWKPVSEQLASARLVGKSNGMQCSGSAFFDPIDGGTCWTCPASYRRTLNSVKSSGACAITLPTRYATASQTGGCSLMPTPVGYGTAFQSILGSGECWSCPVPLLDNWSESRKDASRACTAGGSTDRIVWKMPQYPEPGLYDFVPGLVDIAFADPKRVDDFLGRLAGGSDAGKRALWSSMRSDPGASPAFQALLFAALVTAAEDSGANAQADRSVARFGEYVRARRTFIAREATRMWDAWQVVDDYNKIQAVRRSNGMSISPAVLGSAGADFDAYAWSGAKPDANGLAFLEAAETLGTLPGTGGGVPNYSVDGGFDTILLQPIFEGLGKGFEAFQEMGTNAATSAVGQLATTGRDLALLGKGGSIALILVTQGIDLWQGIQAFVETEQARTRYAKLVAEADRPVPMGKLFTTGNLEQKQQILLFWALAASPHSASAELGTGSLTSSQLCADAGTRNACKEAATVVAGAMQRLGY